MVERTVLGGSVTHCGVCLLQELYHLLTFKN